MTLAKLDTQETPHYQPQGLTQGSTQYWAHNMAPVLEQNPARDLALAGARDPARGPTWARARTTDITTGARGPAKDPTWALARDTCLASAMDQGITRALARTTDLTLARDPP